MNGTSKDFQERLKIEKEINIESENMAVTINNDDRFDVRIGKDSNWSLGLTRDEMEELADIIKISLDHQD